MFGHLSAKVPATDKRFLPVEKFGLKLMSMGYMIEPDQAVVWRGQCSQGGYAVCKRRRVGRLDYLIFDLPPGTASTKPGAEIRGYRKHLGHYASDRGAGRRLPAKAMFDKVRIPVIGMVENMSYFVADDGKEYDIFGRGVVKRPQPKWG